MSGASFRETVQNSNVLTGFCASGTAQQVFNFNDRTNPKPFYVLPYERNESFVTRPEITSRLEELLPMESNDFHSAALWGLGGSGKTQVALEYAYNRCRKSSCSIFWVHAENEATFAHDYGTIAKAMGLDQQAEGNNILQKVQHKIESLNRWLLILDNADDLSVFGVGSAAGNQATELTRCIPKGPNGSILWTSRDKQIGGSLVGPQRNIRVSKMATEESRALLESTRSQLTTNEEFEDMRTLVDELQHLPLAISQAGAYMRRTETSLSQYLSHLKTEQTRWRVLKETEFDRHRVQGSSNSILETYSISIRRIKQENEMAYRILHILAYYDDQDVPRRLIEAAAAYGQENRSREVLERDTKRAIRRLKDFSFLVEHQLEETEQSFEMHKLVQDASRYGLQVGDALRRHETKAKKKSHSLRGRLEQMFKSSEGEEDEVEVEDEKQDEIWFALAAFDIIEGIYPKETVIKKEMWDAYEKYMAHALRACDWAEVYSQGDFASRILQCIAHYHWTRAQFAEGLATNQRRLRLLQKDYGEMNTESLITLSKVATDFLRVGGYRQSEAAENKALQLALALKASDRDEIAWTRQRRWQAKHSMVHRDIYIDQLRLAEAEKLVLQVLEFPKFRVERHQVRYIGALRALGKLHCQQGEDKKAEQVQIELLDLCLELFGENHRSSFVRLPTNQFSSKYHIRPSTK